MPKCKSCDAIIQFIETKNGKLMPVETGVQTFIKTDGSMHKGFLTHWSKCAGAQKHRTKKRKGSA